MKEVPFFARFLEAQDYPEIASDVKAGPGHGGGGGGGGHVTLKYPSDDDEGGVDI
jgi:hypothetical protein